jgi:hypothetical protein
MSGDDQSKRKPGSVSAQMILLSACAVLVPPLLTVAGVMYLRHQKAPGSKLEQSALTKGPNSPRLLS